MAAALPWLRVNGVEIANAARTIPYMQRYASEKFDIQCNLPAVLTREAFTYPCSLYPQDGLFPLSLLYPAECGTFLDPATDDAPWWDATQPESAQFLGVLLDTQFGGLEMTGERTVTSKTAGLQGGRVGPERLQPRVLRLTGALVATSCAGMEYGRRWLGEVLGANLCDPCPLATVEVRLAAPIPDDGSADEMGYWRIYDAAMTSLVFPGNSADPSACDYEQFELELTSENPWLYKAPETLLASTVVNPGAATGQVAFDAWFAPAPVVVAVAVPRPLIGVNDPVIAITGGATDSSGVVAFGAWPQYPDGLLFPSACTYPQSALLAGSQPRPNSTCPVRVALLSVPAGSTVTVDNAQRQITLTDAGGYAQDGTYLVDVPSGEALAWIDATSCGPAYSAAVGVLAACGASDALTAEITIQHRER